MKTELIEYHREQAELSRRSWNAPLAVFHERAVAWLESLNAESRIDEREPKIYSKP